MITNVTIRPFPIYKSIKPKERERLTLNFLRLIRWTREASCSVASVCCTCLGEGDMCTTMAAWQVTEPSASFSNIVSLFSL